MVCEPILVFSLSLSQAEQKSKLVLTFLSCLLAAGEAMLKNFNYHLIWQLRKKIKVVDNSYDHLLPRVKG